MRRAAFLVCLLSSVSLTAQSGSQPDWAKAEEETMRHFQALLRFDTSDPPLNPPGGEKPAAEYIKQVLDKEGIPAQLLSVEPNRPNVVARLKGTGNKRPILLMGHTDVVNVDPKKWTHPPFSATRQDGYVYGRGTVDDKDNATAVLMVMLMLKRQNVALDRDVIALWEAGEEGATRMGIQFMVDQHFPLIDAEYRFAEGGSVQREKGQVKFASIQTVEKIPRGIRLTARGVAGHGSVPLETNAIVHLSDAVAKVGKWAPPIRSNETTAAYFKRLASISSPDEAQRYRDALSPDPKVSGVADAYLRANEPRHASMLRTSVSPNIFQGGYRSNVIPSEAVATLDVRMLPDEDANAFLEQVKKIVNDPAVEVAFSGQASRPPGTTRLNTEAFTVLEANVTKHYKAITLPTMSTGATDMAYLRGKGIQCYGVGPATDFEDGPKGFGAHSDQERILETELHRFVRFHYDIVADLAREKVTTITTTRLSLTPLVPEDRVRLHAIFTLPGVRRFIFDDQLIPLEQTAEIVDKSVALNRDNGLGLWLAELLPSFPSAPSLRSPIGFGGFWYFRDPPELEFLYGVVDEELGRGYGQEIAGALVRYGFETLKMPRIRASCDAGHAVSRRLLEALGFCLERQAIVGGLETAFYEIRKKGSDPFAVSA